ncbi:probable G-protein coupled receptor 139 [Stegostoma tigrinum]|uniref:probable G-protein coupled receptor 139 n=1 Tax=Stegostoma tigrinum TaxID=3053191 RepID=UPI0028700C51|nr:probable G-protein coupled receptor 139 [Stegostoma tigrinum]XP_059498474.1 probable G-protein coupled receptor 139 [Stegostoma tigrinum]
MRKPAILLLKEIYYPLLAAACLPVNMITVFILLRRNSGLSKCISAYMVAMATADLLVTINSIIVYRILSYHFPFSFLSHTPVCKFIVYMITVSLDLTVWFTVSFTFDRFVVICCQRFKAKYCTKRTATTVLTVISVLILLKNIPVLFAYEPEQIINKIQWGCRSSSNFLGSSPGIAFVWFYSAWIAWLPFILMFVFNSLTIHRILVANRIRIGLKGHRIENHSNSEMENRRKSIILLFSVSISFILLWLTHSMSLVITRLSNPNYYRGDFNNPQYVATETGDILKLLSCFLNPCIYVVTQNKFREELSNVMKSLFNKFFD